MIYDQFLVLVDLVPLIGFGGEALVKRHQDNILAFFMLDHISLLLTLE